MNEEQYKRRSVAYHEAGHAIAARSLGVGVGMVHLYAAGGGEVRHEAVDDETRAAIAAAGWLAESIARERYVERNRAAINSGSVALPVWGERMHESTSDAAAVDELLYNRYGGNVEFMRARLVARVKAGLLDAWTDVELIATELLLRTGDGQRGAMMTGDELNAILSGKPQATPAPVVETPAEARARLAKAEADGRRWWPNGKAPIEFDRYLEGVRAKVEGRMVAEPAPLLRRTYAATLRVR